MIDQEFSRTQVGLDALPELLRVLSPLRAVTDPRRLARSVADWVVATVAPGCQVHLKVEGHLEAVADIHGDAAPEPAVIQQVVVSAERTVTPAGTPDRAWVTLPLRAGNETVGALSVLVDHPPGELESNHQRGLAVVASTLARALLNAAAQQRASHVSQALQASLLPGALPEGDWFDLCALYLPGTADLRIGGDWYDSQVMADGAVAISVGDVAGHGVEAAAKMGELRSAMVALRLVRSSPGELVSVVHRLASDLSYFATVLCARLDRGGNLQWAAAGHLPPVVIHEEGRAEVLPNDQSPPLGVGHSGPVPVNRYRLSPGDTVLLFTDGLIERRDRNLERGLQALATRAGRLSRRPLKELVDEIAEERDHPLSTGDDVAILAARWRPDRPLG